MTVLAPLRQPGPPHRGAPLLDLDPDLGALLSGRRLADARAQLVVELVRLDRGAWAGGLPEGADPHHVGLLVIQGALTREVVLEDTISTELLGPGDLIRPWTPDDRPVLLEPQVRWQVVGDARLAVLDRTFAVALLHFPGVNSMLIDRVYARAARMATLKAIAQLNSVDRRLLALFWHLAERWGRVTADGVVLPLSLSHRLLGELIGARRPTVSTTLGALERNGRVLRRDDGTWLIRERPARAPAERSARVVAHRRRLLRAAGDSGSPS